MTSRVMNVERDGEFALIVTWNDADVMRISPRDFVTDERIKAAAQFAAGLEAGGCQEVTYQQLEIAKTRFEWKPKVVV